MDAKDDQPSGAEPESDASDASTDGYGLEPTPEPEPESEPSAAIESPDAVRSGSIGRTTESDTTTPDFETAPESVPLLPSGTWRPWAIAAGVLFAVVCIAVLAGWSTFSRSETVVSSTPRGSRCSMRRKSRLDSS